MIRPIILLLISQSMASKPKYFLNNGLMKNYMYFMPIYKWHETMVNDKDIFPVKSIPSKNDNF